MLFIYFFIYIFLLPQGTVLLMLVPESQPKLDNFDKKMLLDI